MKKRIIKSNARNEGKGERREQVRGTKTRRRKKEGRRGMKETVWGDTDRRRENTEEQCDAEAGTRL